MQIRSGFISALVAIGWSMSADAGDLDNATLALFLPAPLPGSKIDEDVVEPERPDQGIWAGALYRGDATFTLSIARGTPAAANLLALFDNLENIEQSSEMVDIAGVEFVVIVGECFAALPGDLVVACFNYGEDVAKHLETTDFTALSAAALE